MAITKVQDIFEKCLECSIHQGKQMSENGIHLTAGAFSYVDGPGQIDLGGDEHRPCRTGKLTSVKRRGGR